MTKLAEYGSFQDDERSAVEKINEAFSSKVRATVRLIHATRGYEPAGSVARWTNGYYAVRWNDHTGAIQGRRYQNAIEAMNHFQKLTESTSDQFQSRMADTDEAVTVHVNPDGTLSI